MSDSTLAEHELVIGFDAREMFMGLAPPWMEGRRELFLLRDVPGKLLSVDTLVWPSLLGPALPVTEQTRLGLDLSELSSDLSDDLGALPGRLGQRAQERHSIIAVSRFQRHDEASDEPWLIDAQLQLPGGTEWIMMGLDVADEWLISGLSNCGFEPGERSALGDFWSAKLNDHHLFDRFEDADAFRVVTDARVIEHSPFSVFAIRALARADLAMP